MVNEQFSQNNESAELTKKIDSIFKDVDNPTQAELRKSWKVNSFELNGRHVEIIGVGHHPDTLKIPEYKEKLESAIEHASLIVLEGAPVAKQRYPIEDVIKRARSLGNNIPDKEMRYVIHRIVDDNPYERFFQELQNVAARFKKTIATVDPNEDIYKALKLQHEDEVMGKTQLAAFVGSIVAILGVEAVIKISSLIDRFRKDKLVSGSQPKFSRRSFLKLTGSAAAVAVASALPSGALINERVRGQDRKENSLGTALYSFIDYREAAAADALDMLSIQTTGTGPIEVIYGGRHVAGIQHYAEHPTERRIKLQAYKVFSGDPKDAIKIFSFDGEWKNVTARIKPQR